MTRDPPPLRRSGRAALTLAAAAGGLVMPPLPLVRRRAWVLAVAATVLWLGALYVFFAHYAGPGFLAHAGLWLLALLGAAAPRRLARLETSVRRLCGWRPSAGLPG